MRGKAFKHLAAGAVLAIGLAMSAGCSKTEPEAVTPRHTITVHWALSPGGLGDMGYNDIIFAGISAAAKQHEFGLNFYRPLDAEEMVPTVLQWIREPLEPGTRSLFVLGASDFELTVRELMDAGAFPLPDGKDMMMLEYFADDLPVHTIGVVAMSAAFRQAVGKRGDWTMAELYYELYNHTPGSHVTVYNSDNYGNLYSSSLSEFLE